MTLREKIAQLICLRIDGKYYDNDDPQYNNIVQSIEIDGIGGLIVFPGDAYETSKLLYSLQKKSKIPILISSDIERGVGQIFKGGTDFPTNMAMGSTYDPGLVYKQGEIVAREARVIGIHCAYAPVSDVNSNPDNPIINTRSYGEDPNMVGNFVSKYITGLQKNGIIATAKHFPGHGNTSQDSHLMLPVLNIDKKRFDHIESIPFVNAIHSGVEQIMSAHIAFPEITGIDNLPATLSDKIITGILREEMGFKGLIVSDALIMEGVKQGNTEAQRAVISLKAGVDILLYPESYTDVINAIEQAVSEDIITEKRIDESVLRLLYVKERLGLFNDLNYYEEKIFSILSCEEHQKASLDIARNTITAVISSPNQKSLVGNEHFTPLNKHDNIRILIIDEDNIQSSIDTYIQEIKSRNNLSEKDIYIINKESTDMNRVLGGITDNIQLIVGIFSKVRAWKGSTGIGKEILVQINKILAEHKNTIIISFSSPYIYNGLENCQKFICTYSHVGVSVQACVEALFGEIPMAGKLPVSLKGIPLKL